MFADPVQNSIFFDRRENLELMKKRIDGLKKGCRQNVALLGQELVGKSSLLLRLLHELECDKEILPIYLEVRPESLQSFGNRFTGSLLHYYFKSEFQFHSPDSFSTSALPSSFNPAPNESRGGEEKGKELSIGKSDKVNGHVEKERGEIPGGIKELLEKAKGKLPRTVEGILRIEKLFGRRSRDYILSSLFDLLSVLCEEEKKYCVMILDEFQELGSFNIRNPFAVLGQKIMSQKEVMYIVASSSTRRASEILNNDLSLLFGSFEIDTLGAFDMEKSLKFIGKRLDKFTVSKPCMRFLVGISNGHPFYLDSFCREVEVIMNAREMKEVNKSIVAEGISREVFSPRSITYQYLNDFVTRSIDPCSPQDLEILFAIADGNKKSSMIARNISRSSAQTTRRLERLVNSDIILKSGRVYDFCDPLLKWWIKSVYRMRRETFEPVVEGKVEPELQRELEELMSLYMAQEKIGIAERLRSLFGLFRNEVVEIAGKTLKLPKFSSVSTKKVRGKELPVIATSGNGYWIADFAEERVSEDGIGEFLGKLSGFRRKIARKILVCIAGVEQDARLLAKEEGILIWGIRDVNFIFDLYEQPRVVG